MIDLNSNLKLEFELKVTRMQVQGSKKNVGAYNLETMKQMVRIGSNTTVKHFRIRFTG